MPRHPIRLLSKSASLRQATFALGLLVAGFVPVMQLLFDHSRPHVTKPVVAGALLGLLIASSGALPRRWNLRFLLMSSMGLLTLGLAELVCSLMWASGTASIYDWDDRCLYKPRPNSQKIYHRRAINGGQTSEVAINSQGFRGPELTSASDVPRVIVYGDSIVEAEYSQFENTFGEQLRQAVTKLLGQPVTVINAGANGYGPDQVLLRMETELPKVRPQLVVVSVFADNDYGDLLRNKLFRLNEQGELVSNAWQLAENCQHPGLRGRYEPTLWKLARSSIRGLQSWGTGIESYMERWRLECVTEFDEYITQGNSRVHELQVDHYDADIALTPGVPSATYKMRLFGKVLERIAVTCRKNQAKLLLVIIPSPADLIEGYDFCAIDHQRYPRYDARALTDVAASAGRKLHLRAVNLFDPFQQHDPGKLYFRGGDNHWNDAGQRLAAEIVAPLVSELVRSE